jgi:hypothetical protein
MLYKLFEQKNIELWSQQNCVYNETYHILKRQKISFSECVKWMLGMYSFIHSHLATQDLKFKTVTCNKTSSFQNNFQVEVMTTSLHYTHKKKIIQMSQSHTKCYHSFNLEHKICMCRPNTFVATLVSRSLCFQPWAFSLVSAELGYLKC